jgi:ribonuclease III
MDFQAFEQTIAITFTDKALLKQAFIHRSYLNENRTSNLEHNERLEFLGDAVLELVTTDFLYKRFPNKPEGELTAYRSALVNAVTLSEVASKLQMEHYLLLSHGESKDKGRARQIILADTMEALIGAIYIDQGYETAEGFIGQHILILLDDILSKGSWIDDKSRFQEKAQDEYGVTPLYKLVRESGPDHDKHFVMAVFVRDLKLGEGDGKSKQEAEQRAARNALASKGWA